MECMATDEVPIALDNEVDFRRLMKTIGENLVIRDVVALKFLCQDIIPSSRLEKMSRGLDLLAELERKHKLSSDQYMFLAELLLHIGRLDLIRKLGIEPRSFRATIQKLGPQICSFRLLLQEWVDELTSSEVEEMKFLAAAHLARRSDLDGAENAQEVFIILEKNQVITPHDVNILLQFAEALDRNELSQKVQRFQAGLPILPPSTPTYTKASPLLGSAAPPVGAIPSELHNGGGVPAVPNKMNLNTPYPYQNTNNITNEGVLRPAELAVHHHHHQSPSPEVLNHYPPPPSDELPSYKMDSRPRGICLIINNRNFYQDEKDKDSRKMPTREGTEVDRDNLECVFRKLHFDVDIHNDLTHMEMLQLMQRTAIDTDHTNYDCFACCILTHGVKGELYGVNGRLVEVKDLTNFYKASTCRSLKGKPKLFFIQACQGKHKQIGVGVDIERDAPSLGPNEHGMDLNVETLPNEADFLMGWATLPGFVSYRSKTTGSWYITTLVSMLERYAHREDLLSIMIKVNEEVSRAKAQTKDAYLYKQSPAPVPTLRKKIFFR